MSNKKLKVAIVCDWLDGVGGAEQVLRKVHELYPKAPIYTSTYRTKKIDWFHDAEVKTGWLNIFPTAMRKLIPFLRNGYFRRLNLSEYDLIISVTGAEAKGVRTRKDALHISYIHAPTQYYWQKYQDYLKNPGFGFLDPLVRVALKISVGRLRKVDFEFAQKPDYIIAPSNYIKGEIKKYYKRDATVIFPPVAINDLRGDSKTRRSGFVVTSRQVPWKRLDLAVKACIRCGEQLTVVGEGSEHKRLRKMAKGNEDLIRFLPVMNRVGIKKVLQEAEAYIFPSLEPFGIAPIEALATGTPVIAFGEGGALDYIKNGENGVLFEKQSVASLASAIEKFRKIKFEHKKIVKSAERFSQEVFLEDLKNFINEKII